MPARRAPRKAAVVGFWRRRPSRRPVVFALAGLMAVAAACTSEQPPPDGETPTPTATPPATAPPTPEPTPTPTPVPEVDVPMAVVTGFTNLKAAITEAELEAARDADTLIQPCELLEGGAAPADCLPANEIVRHLQDNPSDLALLPAGLVRPQVKVLPVDGADLFGGPAARQLAYPLTASVQGPPDDWLHEPDEVRTLISLGDSCPDRGVAHAAITLGRGWEWVFGGGTAAYTRVYPNPVPPGHVGNGFNIVDAIPTGNEGAVAELVSGADVTLDDFECPVVESFTVNEGVVFSIDPAVLPQLRDTYGVDVVTLAANHLFDRGTDGFLETLAQFDAAGIERTGAGTDLHEALTPAFIDAGGVTIGFVGFNEIPGSLEAGPRQPGVAWLTEANVREAVGRARATADVVICTPQWWGGAEYHAAFIGAMREQQAYMLDAGCDHILGHGTHWSGPIELQTDADGRDRFTIVSHGNFLFGQEWSQQTQEGVIVELAFRGTELAQARMHPYIMLEQAQANLTDPETDGAYVLNRILEASGLGAP
jgi:poly-gamma-glutamate capsule biosynthesis protein CapA/YwtB (metallophosphatase superfamily)